MRTKQTCKYIHNSFTCNGFSLTKSLFLHINNLISVNNANCDTINLIYNAPQKKIGWREVK